MAGIGGEAKRIKLVVAYEGTEYCGWQVQPNGITIEGVLNNALSKLLGDDIQVIGASRTDAGVHSLGNVAVFDTRAKIPPEKICYALNQRLPEDIVVQSSCQVPDGFHPRRCYSEKTYEYRTLNRKIPIPTLRRDTYFYYRDLDLMKMQQAAGYFVGEHDFKSFCTAKSNVEDTVRTIYSLDIKRDGDKIVLCISGSGFLYNMVRIIAGTLIRVGTGAFPPEAVSEILAARDRRLAGPTAPA